MKIPSGVALSVEENSIKAKGPNGEVSRPYNPRMLSIQVKGDEVEVALKTKENRKAGALKNTFLAHLKNMMAGVQKNYAIHMKLLYAHFPVTLKVEGSYITITNFLGEKVPRKSKIAGKTKVILSKQEITVEGNSKEDVGQTAANLVKATKIRKRDARVFQDGIYYAK